MGSFSHSAHATPGRPLRRPPSLSRLAGLVLAAAAASALALGTALGDRCGRAPSASIDVPADGPSSVEAGPPAWPDHAVELASAWAPPFHRATPVRLFLDPGHGAEGNTGNLSASCEAEQDFTLRLATALAAELDSTETVVVATSRAAGSLVPYAERVDRAREWHAELFISLHSDVRGRWLVSDADAAPLCPEAREEPGFAVLYSDEGDGRLVAARRELARNLAWQLLQIGLPAYDGAGYRDLYEPDSELSGVFADRHAPGKRIFVLRAATMPSVILETHNAWHPGEVERWNEPRTVEAVASAIRAAVLQTISSLDRAAEGAAVDPTTGA